MSRVAIEGNASGSGTFTIAAPNSNSSRIISIPDGTGTMVVNGVGSAIVSGTSQASTSGTSIDFTGIPSWVKQITLMLDAVSTNGASQWLVQLGTSSGFEITGYNSVASFLGSTTGSTNQTAGYGIRSTSATHVMYGSIIFSLLGSNTWTAQGLFSGAGGGSGFTYTTSGTKTLSGTLTQIRLTTVNGTDAFDAGSINILYG